MKKNNFKLSSQSLSDYLRTFLDPLTKAIILVGLLFIGLYSTNLVILISTTFIAFIIFAGSHRSVKVVIRALLLGITIALISVGLLWLITDLYRPYFAFGMIVSRFFVAIFTVEWFFATVSPYELAYMLERIKFSATLSWMIMLIYQQIPLLTQEFQRINEARKLKGLTARLWQPKRLTKLLKTLLNPLIASTINQSVDYAQAMILRGFTLKKQKERFINFRLRLQDIFVIIAILGFIAAVIIVRTNHLLKVFEW
ncbi:MAG: energy-coupling factor transporter transmembrane component T family protein [Candidatus Heimdallarchaeaceae archaeon]